MDIYEPLFQKNYTRKSNRAAKGYDKLDELVGKGEIEPFDTILDVGCSWGRNLRYWRDKGHKVTGVDVSPKMIDRLKGKGFDVHLSSATDLSIFPDNSFDLYMSTDVYEHLRTEDLEAALEEAKRVSKKYILIQPHPSLDRRGRKKPHKALHLTVWEMEKWEEFFKSHGLLFIPLSDDKNWYKHNFLMRIDKDV
jgi:cyclopropane fatty-acyl-phospholipid synthase-like methyltransferase